MFVSNYRICCANEVCSGIVVAVACPETGARILVGELAVKVAESGELHVECGAFPERFRRSSAKGVLEILLRGERPAFGAQAVCRSAPSVKATHAFAVGMVIAVANAGIGNIGVHVFSHPDFSAEICGLVGLFGAHERVCRFVVIASVGLFASGE